VVETGTATFYTALHACAQEPVLKQLTGFIRRDEVRHYNYFAASTRSTRPRSVWAPRRARALRKRFTEAEQEDAYIGFKHAWLMLFPGQPFRGEYFAEFIRQVRQVVAPHYPYRMAMQMLLQPLDLNRTVHKLAVPLLERGARRLMFQ
jgi:hypothetical protein